MEELRLAWKDDTNGVKLKNYDVECGTIPPNNLATLSPDELCLQIPA